VVPFEVEASRLGEAHADDLQCFLEAVDGVGEVESVGVDVHSLAGPDSEYRCVLRHVREGEHRLGDEDGVAPDGIRDAHPESQVPGLAGQIAQ
jgi:hypothetical protein